jgi:hypothetical protein
MAKMAMLRIILCMTLDALRTMLSRRPFEPMRISMSSGAVFEVRHLEMASLGKSAMLVVLPDSDGGPSDRWEFLSYLHIAHVETLASSGRAA